MKLIHYGGERSDLRKHIFLAVLLILAEVSGFAQPLAGHDSVQVSDFCNSYIELGLIGASSRRSPFWLYANQWGSVPAESPAAIFSGGIEMRRSMVRKSSGKTVTAFSGGVEVVGIAGLNAAVLVPQAYAGISLKGLELRVGRWKQYVGLNDYSLGTGSYIWAGNALPIPKIQLGFQNYTPVPFTRNFLSFKGFYSDGFFETNRTVTSELKLHNKSFFLRVGRPKGKVRLHGGFNHAVQWGGKSPYHTENGRMPGGLKNYINAVTGMKPHGRLANASGFDNGNRVGNHVASVDVAAELDLKKIHIFLYRQNLVEDGSLFYLNNIKDGLNGVSLSLKEKPENGFALHRVTAEFLYTKSQGGSKMEEGSHIRGNDDYFNNGQVRDGWSYQGRALGTPFITPGRDNTWPAYADFFTNNNRIWVAHLGVQGKAGECLWMSKLSYSDNDGSYAAPFPEQIGQFSGIVSIHRPVRWLGGTMLNASLSADRGRLFKDVAGIRLGIRKTGLIRKRNAQTETGPGTSSNNLLFAGI